MKKRDKAERVYRKRTQIRKTYQEPMSNVIARMAEDNAVSRAKGYQDEKQNPDAPIESG